MRYAVLLALNIYVFSIPLETIVIAGVGTPQRLLAILVAGLWTATVLVERRGKIRVPRWWLSLGLFGVWVVTSISWAQDVSAAVSSASSILQLVMFSLVVTDVVEGQRADRLLAWYSAGAVCAAVLALHAGKTFSSTSRLELMGAGPAHFAAAVWPAVLYLAYRATLPAKLAGRVLTIVAAGLLMAVVLTTGTRSAWVALFVAATVLAMRAPRARWGAVLAGAVLVTLILIVPSLYQRAIVSSAANWGEGRVDIWKVGRVIAAEHPIRGVGAGNFPVHFTWDVIAQVGSFLFPVAIHPGRDAHNIFLQIMVELGLVGAGLFLLPLLAAVLAGLSKRAPVTHRLVVAMLLGYLAEGFFLPILNHKYFWFVIGLSCAVLKQRRGQRSASEGNPLSEEAPARP